jgi:hypothetical protein
MKKLRAKKFVQKKTTPVKSVKKILPKVKTPSISSKAK